MNYKLNIEKELKEYVVRIEHQYLDGVQYIFKFENGYGASVVKHAYSYGRDDDRWEMAVIWFHDDNKYHLSYATSVTDDVIGYLDDEKVSKYLHMIKRLDTHGQLSCKHGFDMNDFCSIECYGDCDNCIWEKEHAKDKGEN